MQGSKVGPSPQRCSNCVFCVFVLLIAMFTIMTMIINGDITDWRMVEPLGRGPGWPTGPVPGHSWTSRQVELGL